MNFSPAQMKAFGARMRLAREAHGWSRQELCDLIATLDDAPSTYSPQRLANYENGTRAPESVTDVRAIEKALRLDAGRLSQHLGFLPLDGDCPQFTVEDAVAQSPLSLQDQRGLIMAYRQALEVTEVA